MRSVSRRAFLGAPALAAAALPLAGGQSGKTRIGLVASSHSRLAKPRSLDDPLDYPAVRDMVWKAIEYGSPRAGSLAAKIRPGSWVVVKPNLGSLPPRESFVLGDVADLRVTRAVIEYLATQSRAARITFAEGGTYRRIGDPEPDNVMVQNGVRVDARTYAWSDEFPGFHGTIGAMLREFGASFPGKKFDYVDLSYDAARDSSGAFRWMEVPRSPNGVGAFGEKKVYVPANTILNCDFLVSIPVMKVHMGCGVTACLKNYVGTAPRMVYAPKGSFSNGDLHRNHSLEGRIDSFVADLAAFHPPDYCVVDGIRGLQNSEHGIGVPGQMIRSNLVLAGEDPVATDALVASLLGYQPWDIEFLHMASQRQMGSMDLRDADVTGDDPAGFRRRWAKPRNWYGRCNREWRVTADAAASMETWQRLTTRGDTLHLAAWKPAAAEDATYRAAVRVTASGSRKGFLWVGARGRVAATLNGQKVLEEEGATRYRIGQFQAPVELRPGENLLVFEVKSLGGVADLSALVTGPDNDGDSLEGIRWAAS